MRHTPAVEVRELEGDERTEALEQFRPGLPFPIALALASFAPEGSAIHAQVEATLVKADLAYQHYKDSGEIWRDEVRRAAELDRVWGVE
jgi:hypothetical protein